MPLLELLEPFFEPAQVISPLYFPYISPISPLYLPHISPVSPYQARGAVARLEHDAVRHAEELAEARAGQVIYSEPKP